MNTNNLKFNKVYILISLILTLILIGCASYQANRSNSGKIVDDDGKVITVTIGDYETPQIGEKYKIFYYKDLISQDSKAKTTKLQKKYIGEIKITEISKDNNVKGIIVNGKAKVGYKVELKDKKFEKFDYSIIDNIFN